jgi:geranylgeranyl diphosphate synthase type II
MNFEDRTSVSEKEYMEMIELKTAVLIAASLQIGATLGGASQTDAEDLYQFGKNLGIAFQLQDDLLDTYGDPEVVGKKIGTDILDNKKTLLMIKALDRADPDQKKALTGWLTSKKFDPEEKIKAVTDIFNTLDIKNIVENKIHEYYEKAVASLKEVNRADERKAELYNFASFLLNRDR